MDIFQNTPGLPGLFVAGIFSAALSSLSTGLNSLSAVVLEDFIKPQVKAPLSEQTINYIMRGIVLICGFSCVALVFIVQHLGAVLQMSMSISGITNGPLFGIFIMGLTIPWINSESAFYGGLSGLFSVIYISFKAQAAIASGEIYYKTKPFSVNGCSYDFDRSILNMTHGPEVHELEFKSLHHISYLWYILFGTMVTILASFVFSLMFGFQRTNELNQTVIAPFLRKYFILKSPNIIENVVQLECITHRFVDSDQDNTKCS